MPVGEKTKQKIRKEVQYLESKEAIKSLVDSIGYESILRHMAEELDHIDNLTNTQSVYVFELLSHLDKMLEIYPMIKNV